MVRRGLLHSLIIPVLLFRVGLYADSAFASNRFPWIVEGYCARGIAPALPGLEEYRNRLEPLLDRARAVIRSQNASERVLLSKELVRALSEILRAEAISHRVSADGRWLDILPSNEGPFISQFAERLQSETSQKGILRYMPELLFNDAYSVLTGFSERAVLYLTHFDLLDGPSSDFFQFQATHYQMMEEHHFRAVQSGRGSSPFSRVTDAELAVDYLRDRDVEPSYGKNPKIEKAISEYFKKAESLDLLIDKKDPWTVRFGPASRIFREGLRDISGLRVLRQEIGELRDARVFDPQGLVERPKLKRYAVDLFLAESEQDERIRRHLPGLYPSTVSRRISLPGGETLHQLSGDGAPDSVLTAYLQFLARIYRGYKDLKLSEDLLEMITKATRKMKAQSQLVFWSRTRNFLESPDPQKITTGLIFVVKEKPGDQLPLLAMRNLPADTLNTPGLEEILVEMGRLGSSLTPAESKEETLRLLRVAALDLYNRYGRYSSRKIRIFCEGNAVRERWLKPIGFSRAAQQLKDIPFYQSGGDHLLETDLETLLLALFK